MLTVLTPRKGLVTVADAPDNTGIMVRFTNPTRSANEQVTVWCEPGGDGFRLMRREPGGALRIERAPNRSALYDATVRLQASLIGSGWLPVVAGETAAPRRRADRFGHFPR